MLGNLDTKTFVSLQFVVGKKSSFGRIWPDRIWPILFLLRVGAAARDGYSGRIHFHPTSISSTDIFIQTRFDPMTLSSKHDFIQ